MIIRQWLRYPELIPKAFNGCDVSRDNIFFTKPALIFPDLALCFIQVVDQDIYCF